MDILVTGGNGFIGSKLIDKLTKEGHNVENFDIKFDKNVCEYNVVLDAFQRNDCAFHLAAVADVWKTDKSALFDSNIMGVRNIEKASEVTDTPVMFTSSITAKNPTNLYAETKFIAEKILKDSQAPVSWIRLSNVIGANTNKGQVSAMVEQAVSNNKIEVWGEGEIKRSYVTVERVCEILFTHLEDYKSDKRQTEFCGEIGSQTMTNLEMARLISKYVPNVEIECIPKTPPSPKELYVENTDGRDITDGVEKLVNSKQT
jgi:nucleoside-diphosphate-sugar epimerase